MSDDEDNANGQIYGASFKDRERAQGRAGEEASEDQTTPEGKWNMRVMTLTVKEKIKFEDVKDMANQVDNDKYLNLNPYTFVFAYMIVNFTGSDPINKAKLTTVKNKITDEISPIEKQPFLNFMNLSDVIRYAFLIRAIKDKS